MFCLLLLLDINGYFRDLWEETDVTTNPWGIMQNNKSECLRGIIHQALAYPTGLTKQDRETAERLHRNLRTGEDLFRISAELPKNSNGSSSVLPRKPTKRKLTRP